MDGYDYLLRLASLSLSFVGFSAIVVTLRRALGGQLAATHIEVVRLFISGGLAVTAYGLFPSLLRLFGVSDEIIWQGLSLAAGVPLAIWFASNYRARSRLFPGRLPFLVGVNIAISVIAVAALALNAFGILFKPNVAPYALALTWVLFRSGVIFLRTLEMFLERPTKKGG